MREGPCGGDVLFDAVDEVAAREAERHRDRVANGLWRRAAVADDAQARDAKDRRAAKLRVVDALAEAAERAPREQIADLTGKRALQLVAEERFHGLDEPLARLQDDVAREAVAHDDVRAAAVNLASL